MMERFGRRWVRLSRALSVFRDVLPPCQRQGNGSGRTAGSTACDNQILIKTATISPERARCAIKAEMWRDHRNASQEEDDVPCYVTGRKSLEHSAGYACNTERIGQYRKRDG
jgi:hypothetical protein